MGLPSSSTPTLMGRTRALTLAEGHGSQVGMKMYLCIGM
jgi:hypothetical protein